MSRFGLNGGSYQAESPLADAELSMNLYPEVGPDAAKSGMALYGTPGLTSFVNLPDSPLRGELQVNDYMFAVAGKSLFSILSDGTVATVSAMLANDGNPVSMCAGGSYILIVSGLFAYYYNISTGSFGSITNLGTSNTYTITAAGAGQGVSLIAGTASTITSATDDGTFFTFTLSAALGNGGSFSPRSGDGVVISGVTVSAYNGTRSICSISADGKTVTVAHTPGAANSASSGGTCTAYHVEIRVTGFTGSNSPTPGLVGGQVTLSSVTDSTWDIDLVCGTAFRVVVGSPRFWIYCRATAALITLAPADSGSGTVTLNYSPVTTDFCDGYFIQQFQNTQTWQISGINDPTSWSALDVSGISIFPDNLVGIKVDHREVWLFAQTKTAIYQNTGATPPLFPFSPVQGAYIEQGSISPFGPVRADNSLFWPGRDERGSLMFWRANGYQPQCVSTRAVEYQWSQYSTVSDIICSSYQEAGHTFVVVSFPTANATWVLDLSNGLWHQRGSSNDGATFTAHKAMFHAFCFNKHLIGNLNEGTIYQQSIGLLSDNGSAIYRIRQAPVISSEHEYMVHDRLEILLEPGLTTFAAGGPSVGESQFILEDSTGGQWLLQVLDSGLVQLSAGSGTSQDVYFQDSALAFWKLGVTVDGVLTVTAASSPPASYFISSINFITTPSLLQATLGVTTLGVLQASIVASPDRGAQITVYWSDDFGKTWSNGRTLDCGVTGAYKQRIITRRLGISRARIYKLVMSDAAAYRIVDAYVEATPGMSPKPRLAEQMRQVA